MKLNGIEIKTGATRNPGISADESQKHDVTHVHIYISSEEFGIIVYKALQEAAERGLIPKIF
jgi:hypothetical protein